MAFSNWPCTHNCRGVRLCPVLQGCLIQAATHSCSLRLIRSTKQNCRHHKSTSDMESRIPMCSIYIKSLWKSSRTSVKTSLHKRSMCWLWMLLPTSAEPLPVPLLSSMYCTTSTFSPPLSQRTQEGSPHWPTASIKQAKTVEALLFVLHDRNTGILVKPSTHPCTTNCHLISLWLPSKCQRARGRDRINTSINSSASANRYSYGVNSLQGLPQSFSGYCNVTRSEETKQILGPTVRMKNLDVSYLAIQLLIRDVENDLDEMPYSARRRSMVLVDT